MRAASEGVVVDPPKSRRRVEKIVDGFSWHDTQPAKQGLNSELDLHQGEPQLMGACWHSVALGTNRTNRQLAEWLALTRGGSDAKVPLMRYFLFVGGVLLALLFVSDAYAPKSLIMSRAGTTATTENPTLRIRSDRKWPESVVFDTSLRTIVPAPTAKTAASVPAPITIADVSAKVRVLDPFAQSTDQNTPEPKLQRKRKIAKIHIAPRMVLVAQQPRFGFFANDTW